jgi:tetratricopeptide (TPR) repeat protein
LSAPPPNPPPRGRPWWLAAALLGLGLTALYWDALRAGFLSDDYVFLEQVRAHGWLGSLWAPDPLANFFRPFSRQLYFAILHTLAGTDPFPYHLANLALFLTALVLLADLLLTWVPPSAALAGVAYFALLPGQRVLLTWVSCAQDLLALVGALAALAFFRRGRLAWATAAYALAAFSKESALPLPALLLLWSRWSEGRGWRQAAARVAGPAAVALIWVVTAAAWHQGQPAARGWTRLGISEAAAAFVHMLQSFIFLENPPRALESLLQRPPSWAALALLAPVALWLPARAARAGRERTGHAQRYALAWCALTGLPLAAVAHTWSAYYYTLAAVGAALAVAGWSVRLDRPGWLALMAGLLWLHAGACQMRAFAVAERPWVWTSRVTPFFVARGADYVRRLSGQMLRLEPAPPPDARFFFATLPPYAGFQAGNGALLRALYRRPDLRSYFYSQFSESTAGSAPCDFFYWDGARVKRLYRATQDRFIQVAGDLLLFDRSAGARHALRRALAAGEDPREAYYWLGWAWLYEGDRARAEEAWRRMGARDSALAYWRALDVAQHAEARGDTVAAQRLYLSAVAWHVGRPEVHRRLGELLIAREPKYALLELQVALFLDPTDSTSRRRLAIGLARLGLLEQVVRQIEDLWSRYPSLRADRELQAAFAAARAGASPGPDVAEFPPAAAPRGREGG